MMGGGAGMGTGRGYLTDLDIQKLDPEMVKLLRVRKLSSIIRKQSRSRPAIEWVPLSRLVDTPVAERWSEPVKRTRTRRPKAPEIDLDPVRRVNLDDD